ncbi:MarR family 2-MHQ and catechol resistance regulon transcriptional repressor [Arcticibacter pallidicorallinus]|uniref:MarR family 2-MHQ and catechol resistance regulon transcriptional repressor n=1 Tax=Arcticibacter pallidicorallinus TaxID=1259464 RepID=A0A2T0U9I6_9SPHI|nr:MarR family transcriptional regulator [Arcticibacter pallidicorallinus]PRY54528.1 MarR family 2-MHQ and catechol resistance regulon transcriptional repressor [Arcticibacter pallidicorallinus]
MDKVKSSPEIKTLIDSILNVRLGMKQFIQRKIREHGIDLTYEMLQVLAVLWRKGKMNQQDIADNIQKNKASLTSLLDNLEKRGLAVRSEDPSDRRNKIISLTSKGVAYQQRFQPIFNEFYEALSKDIPKEKIADVGTVLAHIYKNLL